MEDGNKEIKLSEEMEWGQCELDEDALEQAAGGGKSAEWLKKADEWIRSKGGSSQ